MDWFPLYNSLRIAVISSVLVFFSGIFAAYYIAKLHPVVKGVLDVILTLPMVLPPTVVGYFILLLLGSKRPFGIWFYNTFGTKLVMNWYSGIFAATIVAFPLMYRTARGAFESFDETLAWFRTDTGTFQQLYFLESTYAGLSSGHPGWNRSCLCKGAGRVWCNQYGGRLYTRKDSNHFYHRISVVENQ